MIVFLLLPKLLVLKGSGRSQIIVFLWYKNILSVLYTFVYIQYPEPNGFDCMFIDAKQNKKIRKISWQSESGRLGVSLILIQILFTFKEQSGWILQGPYIIKNRNLEQHYVHQSCIGKSFRLFIKVYLYQFLCWYVDVFCRRVIRG